MSSNVSTIQDNAGEYDDWLEIYNPQDTTVNLSGKYLTDKIDNLIKWQFPANVKIEPKEQILIWCDEDQDQAGPHINFKLSSKGEFIAIVNNDGITIVDSVTIPALNDNESFARENNIGDWFLTTSSTPGASNIVTSISDQLIPKYSYKLEAFPNPFNPSTNIEYEIASPMNVELKIYDILGREVWSTSKIKKEAGIHQLQWNGSDYASNELSSGIYLLNINSETYNKTIKLMLLR
ncbi:MAG: T9SS type A sorting domain-containing protein [Ignavibacteriales bacterium]|nr:T9SS type A sorting domain-containing protein [Ignavibacteriales bacterium]